jgi:hypothetical protein
MIWFLLWTTKTSLCSFSIVKINSQLKTIHKRKIKDETERRGGEGRVNKLNLKQKTKENETGGLKGHRHIF